MLSDSQNELFKTEVAHKIKETISLDDIEMLII